MLEELDAPGEWYLDGTTGTLYFWPPGTDCDRRARGRTRRASARLIAIGAGTRRTSPFAGSRSKAARARPWSCTGQSHCLIAGSTIRGVGDYQRHGRERQRRARNNGVVGNDISDVGSHGIYLERRRPRHR